MKGFWTMSHRTLASVAFAAALVAAPQLVAQSPARGAPVEVRHWVGTWTASPQGALASRAPSIKSFDRQTIRQIVHVSMGGDTVRVRLSNEFGRAPVVIGAARIALSAGGPSIEPGTSHLLTFSGDSSFTIPPGAPALER